jgi:hypothetical protein
LIELHAAAAEGGAVFATEDVFDRVTDAPLQLAQERQGIFDFGFLIFDFPEEAAAGSASVRARDDCLVPAKRGFW